MIKRGNWENTQQTKQKQTGYGKRAKKVWYVEDDNYIRMMNEIEIDTFNKKEKLSQIQWKKI